MNRIFAALLCAALFFGLTANNAYAMPDWPANLSIGADSGIVIDADSGAVLFGKNIHDASAPASITKLLTALVVIESSQLDETVTYSDDAVNNMESGGGNKSNVVVGDTLPLKDCLYAMLLLSCNQSANALAEHVAGSREAFAKMMNDKIKELGCNDSQFANPSGLNDESQYVSAYDMAKIAQAAFANPTLFEIASATAYDMSGTINNPNGWTIYAEHKLLVSSPYKYDAAQAGKIGWTSLAGNTSATYASKDGLHLIAVVLKGSQPQYYLDAQALFDFGFNNFQTFKVPDYERGYTSGTEPVMLGARSYPPEDVSVDEKGAVTLPKGAEFTDAVKELLTTIPAGSPKGAVAQLRYTYNGNEAGSAWVYAKEPETLPEPVAVTEPAAEPEAPKKEKGGGVSLLKGLLIVVGILFILAGGAVAYLLYNRKKEREELERRRQRRKERLREMNCSEEEFKRLVEQRRKTGR